MAEKNCPRCSTRHTYPWGKYCTYSLYSRYREELEEYLNEETERNTKVNPVRGDMEMFQWLNEALHQSKLQSHELIKVAENRLQASMENKFASLKTLIIQRVKYNNYHDNGYIAFPSSTY